TPVPSGTPWAIGSGQRYALGAGYVFSTEETQRDPAYVLRVMVAAATHYDTATGHGLWEGMLPAQVARQGRKAATSS
ncbi:hypothetical protein OFM21_34715, partial [Escherichia coli]|nr:hypothetical protein [Escherichia coli]